MAPAQHLAWLDDNVRWFAAIDTAWLNHDVPNCPGWTVEKVLTHLTFGLGRAYPVALGKSPSTPDELAFDGVQWPKALPAGRPALEAFSHELQRCLATFKATDPAQACWTYAGPGIASFWFRRAAIETALHRIDVAQVVAPSGPTLAAERAVDAVAETIDVVLPLAARLIGAGPPALLIIEEETGKRFNLGNGSPTATVSGRGQSLLEALWGRNGDVDITGDQTTVTTWLTLVEQAFGGR